MRALLIAKKHPPEYLIHRYRARKPHNVIAHYIRKYSSRGNVVLDAFCGSGVVLVEALKNGRRCIGIDINPLATFITKMTLLPVDPLRLERAFEQVKKKAKTRIERLYWTRCDTCGSNETAILWEIISYRVRCPHCRSLVNLSDCQKSPGKPQGQYICWECGQDFNYASLSIAGEKLVKLHYSCWSCGEKATRPPTIADLKRLRFLDRQPVPYWVPTRRLSYPGTKKFLTKRRADSLTDLYTKRNLLALSILLHAINQVKDGKARDFLRLAFSSGLEIVSRLNPHRPLSQKSGWTVHEYWTPAVHAVNNVWHVFAHRYGKLFEAKRSLKTVAIPAEKTDRVLHGYADFTVLTCSSTDLNEIPSSSIDYVLTDPPYGGSIQYFELDAFRIPWIRIGRTGDPAGTRWWREEITINKMQGKNVANYEVMLCECFAEIHRVLKKNKFLTLTFHSTDPRVFNAIMRAVLANGFDLKQMIHQPPAVRSAKASLHPAHSAVGDYMITFRRIDSPVSKLKSKPPVDIQKLALQILHEIISRSDSHLEYAEILDRFYGRLYHRRVPSPAEEILMEEVLSNLMRKKRMAIAR